MSDARLTHEQIDAEELTDWRPMLRALYARFRTGNFTAGLRLVVQIGEAAEAADHHPDLDLRYTHLNVRLFSHDADGVTTRDIELARRISELAAAAGVVAEPRSVSAMELALDTPEHARVKPFWRAVLGYRDSSSSDEEIRNDEGDLPVVWFQPSGSDEPRQRFHIDIYVPRDVAAERVAAAVAAGGTLVAEESNFTVLADLDGNRVCVCV